MASTDGIMCYLFWYYRLCTLLHCVRTLFYRNFMVKNIYRIAVLHQIKREEMLQFAQGAIAGLKVSADVARLVTNPILTNKFDEHKFIIEHTVFFT